MGRAGARGEGGNRLTQCKAGSVHSRASLFSIRAPHLSSSLPPIDTASVFLPSELGPLQERIAQHVHDTWMAWRLAEGWRYGPERNDAERTHPCLVPYGALSDSERSYDRRTAEATLKAIVALGFKIVPPE